jgi:hypothetical protein
MTEEKKTKSTFFKDSLVIWLIVGDVFFNILHFIFLLYFVKKVDFPIILHYNVYFGVDLFASWYWIFLMPALSFLIFFINLAIGFLFYEREEKLAGYLMLFISIIAQCGFAIASASIAMINY